MRVAKWCWEMTPFYARKHSTKKPWILYCWQTPFNLSDLLQVSKNSSNKDAMPALRSQTKFSFESAFVVSMKWCFPFQQLFLFLKGTTTTWIKLNVCILVEVLGAKKEFGLFHIQITRDKDWLCVKWLWFCWTHPAFTRKTVALCCCFISVWFSTRTDVERNHLKRKAVIWKCIPRCFAAKILTNARSWWC